MIHKANVVRATEGLFLEIGKQVAKEFPGIAMDDANIDAICMWLLKDPDKYGVLVATNMFGDIVSDLCAQMVGGLGFACSANIGETLGVFEPSHGSETAMAQKLEGAVAAVIAEGKVRTYDMGGSASTLDMAKAIVAKL